MIGLVITCIIAVSAIVVIPNLSYVNLLYVDQQQLRNIALDTLKTMLIDAGYSASWGTTDDFDPNDVERFGLALAGSSSFYVLDPDKVLKLVPGNPYIGFIEYERTHELLNLRGYGFSFEIISPFNIEHNVTMTPQPPANSIQLNCKVRTSYINGGPLPNAVIRARIIYTTEKDQDVKLNMNTVRNTTDARGISTFNVTVQDPTGDTIENILVIFTASIANISAITTTYQQSQSETVMNATILGDNVTITIPPDAKPRDSIGIANIVVINEDSLDFIYNGTFPYPEDRLTWGQGYKYWTRSFENLQEYGPILTLFNIWGVDGGRGNILVLGPYPNWMGSRVLAYGDPAGARGASSAVKIQRDVVISGMTYIAQLILWKESP